MWSAKKKWGIIAKDVTTLISTTELGKKLFSWAAPCVAVERLRTLADEVTAKHLEPCKSINPDVIDQWWSEMRDESERQNASAVLGHKRVAEFSYRGIACEIEVGSWEQELSIYLACYLKSRFVPHKLLPVSFERDLVTFAPKQEGECDAKIVEQYVACREYVNELLEKHPQDGKVWMDVLRRQQQAPGNMVT